MTPEQQVAPLVLRQSLESLREEYLANNPAGKQKCNDALAALRHIEELIVYTATQAMSPQEALADSDGKERKKRKKDVEPPQ